MDEELLAMLCRCTGRRLGLFLEPLPPCLGGLCGRCVYSFPGTSNCSCGTAPKVEVSGPPPRFGEVEGPWIGIIVKGKVSLIKLPSLQFLIPLHIHHTTCPALIANAEEKTFNYHFSNFCAPSVCPLSSCDYSPANNCLCRPTRESRTGHLSP